MTGYILSAPDIPGDGLMLSILRMHFTQRPLDNSTAERPASESGIPGKEAGSACTARSRGFRYIKERTIPCCIALPHTMR